MKILCPTRSRNHSHYWKLFYFGIFHRKEMQILLFNRADVVIWREQTAHLFGPRCLRVAGALYVPPRLMTTGACALAGWLGNSHITTQSLCLLFSWPVTGHLKPALTGTGRGLSQHLSRAKLLDKWCFYQYKLQLQLNSIRLMQLHQTLTRAKFYKY